MVRSFLIVACSSVKSSRLLSRFHSLVSNSVHNFSTHSMSGSANDREWSDRGHSGNTYDSRYQKNDGFPHHKHGGRNGGQPGSKRPATDHREDGEVPQSLSKLRNQLRQIATADPKFLRGLIAETQAEKILRENEIMRRQLEVFKSGKNTVKELTIKCDQDRSELENAIVMIQSWINEKGEDPR